MFLGNKKCRIYAVLWRFANAYVIVLNAGRKKWQDLLDFGDGKKIKKMKIAKWDVAKDTVDLHSLIPKI